MGQTKLHQTLPRPRVEFISRRSRRQARICHNPVAKRSKGWLSGATMKTGAYIKPRGGQLAVDTAALLSVARACIASVSNSAICACIG